MGFVEECTPLDPTQLFGSLQAVLYSPEKYEQPSASLDAADAIRLRCLGGCSSALPEMQAFSRHSDVFACTITSIDAQSSPGTHALTTAPPVSVVGANGL